MQDIRSSMGNGGGGGGRLFGGGDRRFRPHPNQALKCPRCDSLNTKFCYYNNYNLSQPRHFCKSCRRYWTKGGVLRNVPVGGGCRKAKRSKPKTSSDSQKERKSSTSQHSSSESSSLTATTNTEAASVPSCSSGSGLLSFPNPSSRLFVPENPNPNYESSMLDSLEQVADGGGMFPESGSFTNLMTATSNSGMLGYNFSDISPFRLHHQHHQQQQEQKMTSTVDGLKMQELTAGYLDQTVPVELSGLQNRASNGGLTSLDWHNHSNNGDHQGLFDLPSSVDQAYWSQNQWADNDHSLYLP